MARSPLFFRSSLGFLAAASFAATLACSGSSTGGCSAMTPIPSGRYEGPKTNNAINLRLSPNGINYLNQNWKTLTEMFAPGQKIDLPLPCSVTNAPVIGDVVVADMGSNGCSAESCGLMDGQCTSKDKPKIVTVKITGFQLVPKAPDQLDATVTIAVDTGKIYVDTVDRSHGACLWLSPAKCSVNFNTALASPSSNTLEAQVKFSIDQKWDQLLSFSVAQLDGTRVCGSSGASGKPRCLDSSDLDLSSENNCGTYCSVADWGFVKTFILQQLSPMLQTKINDALGSQSCQACGSGLPACPDLGNATSSCDTARGVCLDDATSKCVPRFLGMEGRVAPGALMSGFGVPAESQLDVSVAAGSSVSVDQGINIGTRAGVTAVQPASCVPLLPPPQLAEVPAPDFDAEAAAAMASESWPTMPDPNNPGQMIKRPYHVGLGISKPFLDLAMYHAHQSGALCLNLSSSTVGLLNTGLFKTFLPSLGTLATRDGKDAPMMIVLRPAKVPQVTIGEGTFDPDTKKPIKPLLRLDIPDLTIDFYAMLDDRYVRLFSLTADISMPLSVIFEGCSSVSPALGDLKQLITNIRTADSEILAEDPKVLADLIPAVIGLAEPAVASALKPFELPSLGAFKMKVDATRGLSNISGTDSYDHLGIYAELMDASASCATATPTTLAALKRSVIPAASEMRLSGKPLPWPVAVLDVKAQGANGTAEFAYRVDGGLWTTFLAPSAQGELEVSHPRFLLQGKHVIEVRSRMAEDPNGVSAPVPVDFTVDWDAPEISLTPDSERGVLEVKAHDQVTSDEKLEYAYRVGQGPLSAFGAPRLIDLTAVEAQGGLEVQVKDEAGNIGHAVYRVPVIAERGDGTAPGAAPTIDDVTPRGCSAVGGDAFGLWALVASAGWMWRRRRANTR